MANRVCEFLAQSDASSDKSIRLCNGFLEFDYLFRSYFKCSVFSYNVLLCTVANAGQLDAGVY